MTGRILKSAMMIRSFAKTIEGDRKLWYFLVIKSRQNSIVSHPGLVDILLDGGGIFHIILQKAIDSR